MDLGAGRGPPGERAAAAELDVVGMRADRERAARRRIGRACRSVVGVRSRHGERVERGEVGGDVDVEAELRIAHHPHREAEAVGRWPTWRRNDPGP